MTSLPMIQRAAPPSQAEHRPRRAVAATPGASARFPAARGGIWLLLDSRQAGGIETHVAELAAGLAAAGEAVTVVFLQDHGPHPLRARLAAEGIAWTALAGGLGPLLHALRQAPPAVLHSHGYKANLLGRAAASLLRIRHVASYHAGETPRGALALYDHADRWSSLLSRRIAVSRPILARLPWGGQLIPNFIAVPQAPLPQAAPPSRRVGFCGRLSPEKGPDLFAALARLCPALAFTAYGGGPMQAALAAERPANLAYAGAVDSMDAHWRDIGLLAITSRAEGLPLAALEAMAHGVPVVCFALGGLPELIRDGVDGFLIPPGDIAAMAARVQQVMAMEPAARQAMGQAAHARIAASFSRDAGVAAIRALYHAA